jgi:hypothetical protein
MTSRGISTDPDNLEAVRECLTPKNKHKIRSFLGLCMYYRRFISSFANIVKPLTKLTEEKQVFQWTPEVEATFQTLNEAFCAAHILAYLQPRDRFTVDTNANNVGIGRMLSQIYDVQERVITYYNKIVIKAKRNYCVTWWELLAIMRTLEHFRKYLYR